MIRKAVIISIEGTFLKPSEIDIFKKEKHGELFFSKRNVQSEKPINSSH